MGKYYIYWKDWDGNYFERMSDKDAMLEYVERVNKQYTVHTNGFSGVSIIKGTEVSPSAVGVVTEYKVTNRS